MSDLPVLIADLIEHCPSADAGADLTHIADDTFELGRRLLMRGAGIDPARRVLHHEASPQVGRAPLRLGRPCGPRDRRGAASRRARGGSFMRALLNDPLFIALGRPVVPNPVAIGAVAICPGRLTVVAAVPVIAPTVVIASAVVPAIVGSVETVATSVAPFCAAAIIRPIRTRWAIELARISIAIPVIAVAVRAFETVATFVAPIRTPVIHPAPIGAVGVAIV